jgi:phosphoribosyl-dephospho-CoA transferase
LQVINRVIDEAINSNPAEFNSKSNSKWWYVSTFGKIPRGKVKAPDVVNPSFDITKEDIKTTLEYARLSVSELSSLEKNNFYEHHVLLHLNKRKIKRFLKVHTRHHLRIINDII